MEIEKTPSDAGICGEFSRRSLSAVNACDAAIGWL